MQQKAVTTVKALGMLGNSSRGVLALHKHLLYCTCVVLVAIYRLRLWYLQGARLKGLTNTVSSPVPCGAVDHWLLLGLPHQGDGSVGGIDAHALLLKRLAGVQLRMHSHLGPLPPCLGALGASSGGVNPPSPLGP